MRVRTGPDKVFGIFVRGENRPHVASGDLLFCVRNICEYSAETATHVDGWIVLVGRQLTRQNNVSVENTPRGIGERFVEIITLDDGRSRIERIVHVDLDGESDALNSFFAQCGIERP